MNMPKQLSLGREVGSGAYCKIRLLTEDPDTACKICNTDRSGIPSPELREIVILANLARDCHPNVIEMKWLRLHGRSIVIGMPYIASDLHRIISSRSYSETDIGPIITGILSGTHHLHLRGIIHRDIKPANILMADNKSPKICDFNLAKSFSGFHNLGAHSTNVVTSPYRAPELWSNRTYSYGIDIWAIGVILLELFMRKTIWCANNKVDNCLAFIRNKKSIYFRLPYGELLKGMLTERIQDRWVVEKCLQKSPLRPVLEEKAVVDPPIEVLTNEMYKYFEGERISDYRLKCVANRIHRLSGKSFNPAESVLFARKILYSDDSHTRSVEYITRELQFVVAHAADILVDGSTILKDKHEYNKK